MDGICAECDLEEVGEKGWMNGINMTGGGLIAVWSCSTPELLLGAPFIIYHFSFLKKDLLLM